MCGRFTVINIDKLKNRFDIRGDVPQEFKSSYNVAPGQEMPIVVNENDGNHIRMMRWGLIPHWAKDEKVGYKTINARAEDIMDRPAYRRPFIMQRCIVPANGFYEWKHDGKKRTPYYIHRKDDRLIGFGGLYDTWEDKDTGQKIDTFTIITINPTDKLKKIHDRMPAILSESDEDSWLRQENREPDKLQEILFSTSDKDLEVYRISDKVNKPANNSPELLEKI